jgi:hypothetical protein
MDSHKGQKIIAAIYLVTNHLSDNDPIRMALREYAVVLVEEETDDGKSQVASRIDTLLSAAVFAGLISEKNVSIISLELRHFATPMMESRHAMLASLFAQSDAIRAPQQSVMSYTKSPIEKRTPTLSKPIQSIDSKDARQNKILSFINDRKSAAIKDITTLFPELSEKTIQRELGVLVAKGLITKRGSKRWSVYMSV